MRVAHSRQRLPPDRRFTRLTNAFSKKIDNHIFMLALYFTHYNFCRIHKTLRVTPAMAAGVDTVARDLGWLVNMIEGAAPKPGPRAPYKTAKAALSAGDLNVTVGQADLRDAIREKRKSGKA